MRKLTGKINARLILALQIVIIAYCIIFMLSRFVNFGYDSPRTDLLMAYTLEEQENLSEQCMAIMEDIKVLLDQNDLDGIDKYRCPLHGLPYEITYEDDNIIVSDPDPELQGFKRISVSSKNPDLILID